MKDYIFELWRKIWRHHDHHSYIHKGHGSEFFVQFFFITLHLGDQVNLENFATKFKCYLSKMAWSCDKYKLLKSMFKYVPSCCSTVAMMVAVAASCSPCWATKIESSLTSTWLSALCKIAEKSWITNYWKLIMNWPKEYCYITPTS